MKIRRNTGYTMVTSYQYTMLDIRILLVSATMGVLGIKSLVNGKTLSASEMYDCEKLY